MSNQDKDKEMARSASHRIEISTIGRRTNVRAIRLIGVILGQLEDLRNEDDADKFPHRKRGADQSHRRRLRAEWVGRRSPFQEDR